MAHVQKHPGPRGGWRVRWRDGAGRHRSKSFRTRRDAELALADIGRPEPAGAHAVRRVDDDGEYYVGRYRGPGGEWLETDEFITEQDALDEARELEAELAGAGDGQEE